MIKDLKRAQDLLTEVDKDVRWDWRFNEETNDEKKFLSARGYRLNYYAITAQLARVYLYANMPDEAYEQAAILIEQNSNFEALVGNAGLKAIKNGNVKMFDDIIFALYSPTDQVEWDRLINHTSDTAEGSSEKDKFLGITAEIAERRYGDDLETDWRICYQMEKKNIDDYCTMKYYQQPESFAYSEDNNQIVPMLRMSEVYYIAAEAIYQQDLETAKKYLSHVKKTRGVITDLENVTKDNFMNVLVNDAQREFFGEGQTFFMFKRLMRTMKGREEVQATEENMVLPLPTSESEF